MSAAFHETRRSGYTAFRFSSFAYPDQIFSPASASLWPSWLLGSAAPWRGTTAAGRDPQPSARIFAAPLRPDFAPLLQSGCSHPARLPLPHSPPAPVHGHGVRPTSPPTPPP